MLPAGFILILVFNLERDGAANYNGIDAELLLCGAGFTLIALLVLVMPLCCCDDDDALREEDIDKEHAEMEQAREALEARMLAEKVAGGQPSRADGTNGEIMMAQLDRPSGVGGYGNDLATRELSGSPAANRSGGSQLRGIDDDDH